MNFHSTYVFLCFPIPKPQFSLSISRNEILTVRAELNAASKALVCMPRKSFIFNFVKTFCTVIRNNRVIQTLANPIHSIWMNFSNWNPCQILITNLLWNYWNPKLPKKYLFVVSSRNKSFSIVDEINRVNRTLVFFVLLDKLCRIGIILNNFFVWISYEEWVMLHRVELNAWRHPRTFVILNSLASFSIPQNHWLIKANTQKLRTIMIETNISHSFRMS